MAFSPAFLDELVARNPIEDVVGQYVSLTRRGSNLFGLCPFHAEKTASFLKNKTVQVKKGKQKKVSLAATLNTVSYTHLSVAEK